MADAVGGPLLPRSVGEIVIDRVARGFKVTARLFHPETRVPEILGTDQFPPHGYRHARFYAGKLSEGLHLEIVDKTRDGAQ